MILRPAKTHLKMGCLLCHLLQIMLAVTGSALESPQARGSKSWSQGHSDRIAACMCLAHHQLMAVPVRDSLSTRSPVVSITGWRRKPGPYRDILALECPGQYCWCLLPGKGVWLGTSSKVQWPTGPQCSQTGCQLSPATSTTWACSYPRGEKGI